MIYQHEVDTSRVLVAPYVAAQMTDLLQTAVNTGTGRAAQIGRPVAGKTGTTTSNKDGWFLGFSSGLTTGVWMGRDDAKRVGGLQGGTAPARAFAGFMKAAVAGRPVEEFDTQVTLPEWQMEPDEEVWGEPDNGVFVDEDGNPVARGDVPQQEGTGLPGPDTDERIDQDWIDRMTGRDSESPAPPQQRRDPADRSIPRDEPPPPRREQSDRLPPREPAREPVRPPQNLLPKE